MSMILRRTEESGIIEMVFVSDSAAMYVGTVKIIQVGVLYSCLSDGLYLQRLEHPLSGDVATSS